jgi:HK97 family phage major capsid protein
MYGHEQDSTKVLKERRERTYARLNALGERLAERKSFTPAERDEFDALERDAKQMDFAIKMRKQAKTTAKKGYKGDSRTQGNPREVLASDQSMTAWVNRAAENGVRIQSAEGNQSSILGNSFDLNAYWGQRMGFAKPGAELRALGEDTAGSGQAITPQSWQSSFVDYLYPLTLMGRAGASKLPMDTEIVNLPQFTAPTAPVWAAENAATSLDANPAFAPIQFSAKGAFYDVTLYSIEFAQDAFVQGGLPGMLAESMARKYAIIVDQAALYGISGNTGNPGLVNEAGVNIRKYAAHSGTTGQAPADFNEPSIMAEMVRNANAEPTAFLTSPQLVGTLSRLSATSYAKYWEPGQDIKDLWPALYSTTIPVVETDPASGNPALTGGTMTSLYCGDWSRIVIGMHLDMTTAVLKERYMDSKQYGLFSAMRFSIRATHPETFVRSIGALTT